MDSRREDVEELIIQGLGHRERRNILKIISLTPKGAIYSDILGELGLNTGSMNYHLRQLEGLVERNGERRYHLTPLGKRALAVLGSMTDDLENGYEEYLTQARTPKGEGFVVWAGRWFGLVVVSTFSALLGLFVFVHTGVRAGSFPEVWYYYAAAFALLVVVLRAWLRGWVTREAERIQGGWESLLDRLMGRYR
jgi:DNA-binding MarR family transcriptional regulator